MIIDWIVVVPPLLVTLAFVLLPGLAITRALGMRGLAGLAAAAPVTVGIVGVAAIAFGWLGISWHPLSVTAAVAVIAGVFWVVPVLSRWARPGKLRFAHAVKREQRPAYARSRRWILPVGILIGLSLGAWRLAAYIEDPAGISQTNDAVFHMNAVRYILDTADASSLHVSSLIGANGFYPAAWHAIVSTVVAITGAGIALAGNAFTLVIGAVIWTLGLTWFARTVTGSETVAALTAVLSGALQLFPLLLFQWGVLYPNALSVAMLPATAAAVMTHPRGREASASAARWFRWVVLVGSGVVGIALAQPATLPILGLIIAIWFSDRMLRFPPRGALWQGLILTVAAWLLLIAVWFALATGTGGSHWPPFRGKAEAALDVLLNGQMRIQWAYGVSLLMLVGLAVAWRRRQWRWLVFLWLAVSALYVLVAAVGMPFVRDVLLGAWYADPYRISAYAPLAVIPLAAIGLHSLARLVRRAPLLGDRASPATGNAVAMTAAAVLMLVITALKPVPMPEFIENTFDSESRYLVADDSLLDDDERELLSELDRYVEPGERVIGNPGAGTGFGYMLSGVDVFPRTWSPPRTVEWQRIAEDLRGVAENPAVCSALDSLGDPEYVLDFGPGEDAPGRYLMPGMTGFEDEDGFEIVAQRGDASLWRITACAG